MAEVTIEATPNGPYLVTGPIELTVPRLEGGYQVHSQTATGPTALNVAMSQAGTRTLTLSSQDGGITVNSVAPGYISTEMVAAVPQEALDKIIGKIPVGRLGEPDEVARVVEFLADPDSGFITGQIYSVNGGQYM